MRFQRLDLNLLVALDALLTCRSVTLAADRLCLSQSATSSALARLREYFGDELLVPVKGRNMVLTARAQQLVGPVQAVLRQITSTIAVTPPFDPASSERTLTLMASDYVTEVLLASALQEVSVDAPRMRFDIVPVTDTPVDSLEHGSIDLLLTIDYAISNDHPSQVLFEDDYVVIGWAGNEAMQQEMTRELYFELGHVTARFGKLRVPAFEDWFLRRQTQQRRISVVSPTFLSVASLVAGSNRIATMHRRLAHRLAKYYPLVIKPVPFPIPSIREVAQWHISNNNDPAIRWLVERLSAFSMEGVSASIDCNVVSFDATKAKNAARAEMTEQFRSLSITRS